MIRRVITLAGFVLLAAAPAQAGYPLASYQLAESCLGQFEGGVETLERLLPSLSNADSLRSGVGDDRGMISGFKTAIAAVETADSLDSSRGVAAYLIGKRAWENLKTQEQQAQFDYWKANGKISDRCQDALIDVQSYAAVLDALK